LLRSAIDIFSSVSLTGQREVIKGECCFSGSTWDYKLPRRFSGDKYDTCLYVT